MLYLILAAMAAILVFGAIILVGVAGYMFYKQQPPTSKVDLHSLTPDNHRGRSGEHALPKAGAGWQEEEEEDEDETDATQLFNKEMLNEYADYLDDEDDYEVEDDDEGGGMPGRVVADDT